MSKIPTIKQLFALHPDVPEMQSIPSWCDSANLSRSTFYRLEDPPEVIAFGARRVITRLAHLEWLRRRIIAARQKAA